MTGTSVLFMLLGAALVAAGVLLPAVADRIRGERRETSRGRRAPSTISVEPTVVAAPASPRAAKFRAPPVPAADTSDDVVAAIVGAGYKKATATSATLACSPAERQSIESWTAAALRRCASGVSA